MASFGQLDAQVLGISVDSVPCLQAWAESLGGISYPLLSDFWPHGAISKLYGVMREEGYSERALFLLDRQGIIRYMDIHAIGDQPDNAVVLQEIRKMDPEASRKAATQPEEAPPLPTGGVVMYCTRWCPDCRMGRRWLEQRGIAYTEVDVNANPEAAAQVRLWANGKLVTPTYDISGTIVVNNQWDRLSELLEA
jgi:glutaredoxin